MRLFLFYSAEQIIKHNLFPGTEIRLKSLHFMCSNTNRACLLAMSKFYLYTYFHFGFKCPQQTVPLNIELEKTKRCKKKKKHPRNFLRHRYVSHISGYLTKYCSKRLHFDNIALFFGILQQAYNTINPLALELDI